MYNQNPQHMMGAREHGQLTHTRTCLSTLHKRHGMNKIPGTLRHMNKRLPLQLTVWLLHTGVTNTHVYTNSSTHGTHLTLSCPRRPKTIQHEPTSLFVLPEHVSNGRYTYTPSISMENCTDE